MDCIILSNRKWRYKVDIFWPGLNKTSKNSQFNEAVVSFSTDRD